MGKIKVSSDATCKACGSKGFKRKEWSSDCPLLCENGHSYEHAETTTFGGNNRNNEAGYLPPEFRQRDSRHSAGMSDSAVEKQYSDRIKALRDEGVKRPGGMRHLASIPAEDYFGRQEATGDKNYWDDKGNLAKHKAYHVDHD